MHISHCVQKKHETLWGIISPLKEKHVLLHEMKLRESDLIKMKNIIPLTLIFTVVFVLTGCKKIDTSKYTGTYFGTLTATNFVKEDVELTFTNKNSNKEILYLYDVALKRISEGRYDANEEIILKIIHILNMDITLDVISNTSAVFVFEKNEVTMDMQYNVAGTVSSSNIRYIGHK
jgi:hypothetical protein